MKRIYGVITGIIILGMISAYVIVQENIANNNELEDGDNLNLEDYRPMIGVSVDALVIERWQRDAKVLQAFGEELGYKVEVTNAYEDMQMQKEQIRNLAKEGAKAIIIIAFDKDALVDVIEEVKKKDIIVIAYDRLINDADIDAYISFDNVAVGKYMAEALVKKVPKGNYIIVNGSPKDNNSKMFNEGYYNILQPRIEAGDIIVIEEVWADAWREDIAYNTVGRVLEEGRHIDAVIGANDLLAEAAVSVLSEYGLEGTIPVVGHDADISACQRIVEGKQLMTVYKPLKLLAERAISVADQLIKGETIESEITVYNGFKEVPYIKFDVIPVDQYNMKETVIKDLFHSEEDVYRNVR